MGTPQQGALNARGVEKVAISDQYLAIARKRLKIDGYMLRCFWSALIPLSIHVTLTAIVPGAYPGEAKICLRISWRSQMPAPTGVILVREPNNVPNAAFTPAQQVARNVLLCLLRATYCLKQHVARNTQLVASNKQLAARNMMLVAHPSCSKTDWRKQEITVQLVSLHQWWTLFDFCLLESSWRNDWRYDAIFEIHSSVIKIETIITLFRFSRILMKFSNYAANVWNRYEFYLNRVTSTTSRFPRILWFYNKKM